MDFENRSYNPDGVFRPKPFLVQKTDLMLITTSWSTQNEAELTSTAILQQIEQTAREDVTTLNAPVSESETQVDHLRQSLLVTAQMIYKKTNSKHARLLLESLVLQKIGNSLIWAHVGQPHLFLLRSGRVATLAAQADHSLLDTNLPPLPNSGLGLESQTFVQTGSLRLLAGDQILLLAQSWLPQWPVWEKNPSFRHLTSDLIDRQPTQPFWCGIIRF